MTGKLTLFGFVVYFLFAGVVFECRAEDKAVTAGGQQGLQARYLRYIYSKNSSFQQRRLVAYRHYIKKNDITNPWYYYSE